MDKQILVVGAGVCGIGACSRLTQLGHTRWTMVDKSDFSGGLASSFEKGGFFWDLGVHITSSHYQFYNDLADQGLLAFANNNKKRFDFGGDDLWLRHRRQVHVRYDSDSWIPYPFQNNFYCCKDDKLVEECFDGLVDINQAGAGKTKSVAEYQNFQELVNDFFGKGLAQHFMNPYNFKVWGYPLDQMSAQWVGDRVAKTDLRSNLRKYIQHRQVASLSGGSIQVSDSGWGPNAFFRYPKHGGIGAIWQGAASLLDQQKIELNTEVVEIDVEQKVAKLANSPSVKYDHLINTLPLDILIHKLIKPTKLIDVDQIARTFEPMKHSTIHVVGLGIESKNQPEDQKDKSWLYFPSDRSPFYRCTPQSNLSPFTAPKPEDQWSLQFEICETPYRQVSGDQDQVLEDTIQGAINEKLITKEDAENNIISKFYKKLEYGYPTPYLTRDKFLNYIQPKLKAQGIYSRGRFGGWKYEVSNQDHVLMQGVEAIDNILFGCEEITLFDPDHVNNRKETTHERPMPWDESFIDELKNLITNLNLICCLNFKYQLLAAVPDGDEMLWYNPVDVNV